MEINECRIGKRAGTVVEIRKRQISRVANGFRGLEVRGVVARRSVQGASWYVLEWRFLGKSFFLLVFCRSSHELLITVLGFDDLESIQVVVVVVVVIRMVELRVNVSTGQRSTVDGLKGVN